MQHDEFSDSRIVNIALGAWLFVSSFLWLHTTAELANCALVGAAIVVVGAIGMKTQALRYLNAAAFEPEEGAPATSNALPRASSASIGSDALR